MPRAKYPLLLRERMMEFAKGKKNVPGISYHESGEWEIL
jgi:hypothetical protein